MKKPLLLLLLCVPLLVFPQENKSISTDYILEINARALYLDSNGKVNKAIKLLDSCLVLINQNKHLDSYERLVVLGNKAYLLNKLGFFKEALIINNKKLDALELYFPEKKTNLSVVLNNIANNYTTLGKHDNGLITINRAILIHEDVINDHEEKITQLRKEYELIKEENKNRVKKLTTEQLKITLELDDKAAAHEETSLKLKKIYLSRYYILLNTKSIILSNLGYYDESLLLDLKILEYREKNLGIYDDHYISSLNNIAITYSYLGEEAQALAYSIKSNDLRLQKHGYNSKEYISSLIQLSNAYSSLLNHQESENILLEAIEIYKFNKFDHLPLKAYLYHQLTRAYINQIHPIEALPYARYTLKIYLGLFGENHEKTAMVFNDLASMHSQMNNLDSAIFYQELSLNIFKEKCGENHVNYLSAYSNMAIYYGEKGDIDNELEIKKDILKKYEKIFGVNHDSYIMMLNNIGQLYYLTLHDNGRAFNIFSKVFNLKRNSYEQLELSLSEEDLQIKFQDLIITYDMMFYTKPSSIETYNASIFIKGKSVNRLSRTINSIHENRDETGLILYTNWKELNNDIINLYESNNINDYHIVLQDSLLRYEREILKHASNTYEVSSYSFTDVINKLNKGESFIDITYIPKLIIEGSQLSFAEGNYHAYISKKGDAVPQLVNLGSLSYFESIYSDYSNYTQERPSNKEFSYGDIVYGNICYQKFWGKLEPYLEDVSTVYFSTEGVYRKINPNVLYDTTSSNFLIDKYDIVYVYNVEDFVRQKENYSPFQKSDNNDVVIFGNPTFHLSDKELFVLDSKRSLIITELDTLQRGMTISQLPGTQKEIDIISKNFINKDWNVRLFSALEATEENVKKIDTPKILHIATHGYFFKDIEHQENFTQQVINKEYDNPMLRSGLLFTGSGNTGDGELLKGDNGWLTSYEVSLIDLRGTELVVLSACETGMGDVQNGKGVYGLQRAIRVAGAESLLMSMWEVDDKATQELMTYFYDYWIDKKMSKKEAFKKAQEKIREKYKHPYYWGAFIMLGK